MPEEGPANARHSDSGAKRFGVLARNALRNGAAAPVDWTGGGGAGAVAGGTRGRRGVVLRPTAEGFGLPTGLTARTALTRSYSACVSPWGHWQLAPLGQAPS